MLSRTCTASHLDFFHFSSDQVLIFAICIGSQVYCYYRSLPMPITSYKFGYDDSISGNKIVEDNGQFVSSVCWRQKSNMVVAANSMGKMEVLKMV